jgi:hypothetical protein
MPTLTLTANQTVLAKPACKDATTNLQRFSTAELKKQSLASIYGR